MMGMLDLDANQSFDEQAVTLVNQAERSNESHMMAQEMREHGGGKGPSCQGGPWINPSKYLVDRAIDRWTVNNLRADNTSVVTVMLDPPGPPKAQARIKT